jgi:hypothetical protein
MFVALLLASALNAPSQVSQFRAAFPEASVIVSPTGGTITNASGFETNPLGSTPVSAARSFLVRYGPAFGVMRGDELVVRASPAPGQAGPVRFERRRRGLPIFDADVVVGVTGSNAIILVNGADVPARFSGRALVSRRAAVRAATSAVPDAQTAAGAPRATLGWRATPGCFRPVWRVEFVSTQGSGEWRTFVDAETGKVLFRVPTRSETPRFGTP